MFLVFLVFKLVISDDFFIYKAKDKDNISVIVYSVSKPPLYGEKGALNKALADNGFNIDKTLAYGEDIKISKSIASRSCNYELDSNNYLTIKKFIKTTLESNELMCNKIETIPASKIENTKKNREPDSFDENKLEKNWALAFYPYINYKRVDLIDLSNNANGSLLSKTNYGFEFRWEQFLNKRFTSAVFIDYQVNSFQIPENKILKNSSFSLLYFGVLAAYEVLDFFNILFKISYGQSYYFRAKSTTELIFDSNLNLKADGILFFNLYNVNPFKISMSFGLSYSPKTLLPENYYSKTNISYLSGIHLEQMFKNFAFNTSFVFNNINSDTDLFKQKNTEVYLLGGIKCLF